MSPVATSVTVNPLPVQEDTELNQPQTRSTLESIRDFFRSIKTTISKGAHFLWDKISKFSGFFAIACCPCPIGIALGITAGISEITVGFVYDKACQLFNKKFHETTQQTKTQELCRLILLAGAKYGIFTGLGYWLMGTVISALIFGQVALVMVIINLLLLKYRADQPCQNANKPCHMAAMQKA